MGALEDGAFSKIVLNFGAVSFGCSSNFNPFFASCNLVDKEAVGKTEGTTSRLHCSQALITTSCQWVCFFCQRSADNLTSVRTVIKGIISATPNSVAFCTIQSILSPFPT